MKILLAFTLSKACLPNFTDDISSSVVIFSLLRVKDVVNHYSAEFVAVLVIFQEIFPLLLIISLTALLKYLILTNEATDMHIAVVYLD